MHGIHAEGLEVANGARFGQSQEFALVGEASRLVNREVAMMHLIEDEVLGRDAGTGVGVPTGGVGIGHVDNGTTLAVHAHCRSPYTGTLAVKLAAILHVEGVELAFQVALDSGLPQRATCLSPFHVNGLDRLAPQSVLVDAQFHLLSVLVGLHAESARTGAIGDPGACVDGLRYE